LKPKGHLSRKLSTYFLMIRDKGPPNELKK